MTGNRTLWVLAGVCLFQGGFIAGQIFDNPAYANEPTDADLVDVVDAVSPGSPSMLCKAFPVDTDAPLVDTTDTKSALGEWVSDREGDGWVMYGVDLEIPSKSTGFPQAWAQVCLYKQ